MSANTLLGVGHLIMLTRLLLGVATWIFTLSGTQAQQVLDRVVLEVNKKTYAQRYVEIYLASKDILSESSLIIWKTSNAEAWGVALNDFMHHAILDQEAIRLNTFRPSSRLLDAAEQIITQQRRKIPELDQYFIQLKTDKATLREALGQFYRVKSFIRGRSFGAQGEDIPLTGFEPVPLQAEWYRSIERRANFRTYTDARSYQQISPL